MAASPVSSPPAAKRARLEPNGTTQAEASTSSTPQKLNGEISTSIGNGVSQPIVSSAPVVAPVSADVPSDDEEEPEEVVAQEEEDLGHRDMYLDTVSYKRHSRGQELS
jgi:U4/U6.U5 tri-snRNP-associated protein 2